MKEGAAGTPDPVYGDAMASGQPMRNSDAGRSPNWCGIRAPAILSYQFQFSRVPRGRESVGAAHGSELPYVFGTLSIAAGGQRTRLDTMRWMKLCPDQIQQYWTNFAKTGNPNGGSLPPVAEVRSVGPCLYGPDGERTSAREGLRREACELSVENIGRK